MALIKSKDVPKDAVELNEFEAATYMWGIVINWESLSDTWALRYTPAVLGAINAFSGIIINNHYRRKLQLDRYGYFASVVPISILPGLLTALFHRHLISTEMLLMKETCPICYEVRSGAIQWCIGTAYPMLLGPTSALMLTNRYSTYRIPDLIKGPKVMFQFLRKVTKPFYNTLIYLSVLQLISSSVLTYCEMKNNITLTNKLIEIENKILKKSSD